MFFSWLRSFKKNPKLTIIDSYARTTKNTKVTTIQS